MAKPESTPHDTFGKAAFRNSLIYRPFLRQHTPPDLLMQVAMDRIQVMPVGFPHSNPLQAADVVLRAPMLDGSGWVYWIVELQASRDDTMPLRLLLYKVEVLKVHLQSEEGHHDKRPPIILGIVVYMGHRRWQPTTLDVFAPLDPSLRETARQAFAGESEFVNVKHTDLGALEGEPALQATTLLLQRAYASDKIGVLQQAQPLLEQVYASPGGHALGDAMIRYVLHEAGQRTPEDAKLVVKRIHASLHGVVGEQAMSIADILKHEGKQLGLQEGKLETARNMLIKGMSVTTIAEVTGLPRQKLAALRKKKP